MMMRRADACCHRARKLLARQQCPVAALAAGSFTMAVSSAPITKGTRRGRAGMTRATVRGHWGVVEGTPAKRAEIAGFSLSTAPRNLKLAHGQHVRMHTSAGRFGS